jgi:sigma-B regulation protein RsbU (phosphoserine phosphatase)
VAEFLSILISFSIFTVSYSVRDQRKNLCYIIIGFIFLYVGAIDIFHTLYYKGMQDFITHSCAAKATMFWIIAGLVMAGGLLLAALTPQNRRISLSNLIIGIK